MTGRQRTNRKLVAVILAFVSILTLTCSFSFVEKDDAHAASSEIIVPDQYSTIQEAINNAFDGDTIFVKAGTYYEHLVINKTLSLVGEDANTTVVDGSGTGHVIDIVSDNVNVTDFTVQRSGSILWPALDAGICLNGTRGCVISGNNIVDNACFGISLIDGEQNVVSGNNLARNPLYTIDLTTSSNNIISSNSIRDAVVGIVMHLSSQSNIILENTIANNTYGIVAANVSNNVISGNYFSDNSEIGIWMEDHAINNVIRGNNVTGSTCCIKIDTQADNNTLSENILTDGRFGIYILNARYTEICTNTVAHNYGSDWDAGVRLESAGYTVIRDNEIIDNWRGILLYASSPYVSVHGNNVTSNEYGIRVAMGGSNYVNISGNYVANNRGYGIDVTGFGGGGESNYATIARNLIVNNTFEAVGLGIGSNYNTVVQNNMIGNGHAGVTLERYSNYNTIVQNNMIENAYGICFDLYIVNSTQNMILNNNMINNTQQVRIVPGSVNNWDGGYSAGGNYWSDYAGVDLFGGPVQNETGSDGVGDEAYVIDTNNMDHYPLKKPFPCMPHDLGVTQVPSSKTVIGQNYGITLGSTIFNYGSYAETFNFSFCANSTCLMSGILTVGNRSFVSTTFKWNTSGLAFGDYTLLALATAVPGETEISDNNRTEMIHIGIPGDVSGSEPGIYDKVVDMRDINYTILLFNTKPPSPNWNPNADVNNDGVCNMRDIQIAILNFNKHE